MKNFKIEVPQGYEIDKDHSTFENIVFKKVDELPSSWRDLKDIRGYFVEGASAISSYEGYSQHKNRNIFATKEQAEASLALAQLSQLREVYRNGWKPDWNDYRRKYGISLYKNEIYASRHCAYSHFLSFQDAETRDLFLKNFRDLIEQAKLLIS